MKSVDVIRRLHEHRMWVNRNLLDAVRGLTDGELRKTLPIGQGSVWQTLTHLMGAEFVWLEALQGNETPLMPGDAPGKLPGNQQGEDPVSSLEDLEERWLELDGRWREYLDSLSADALDEFMTKLSTSSRAGQRTATRRADVLLHVCTHAQYTTAQLVNMLRQLGATEFPETMLISLARQDPEK